MTNLQLLHLTSWITRRGWKLTYALGRDTLTGKAFCSATAGLVTGRGRNVHEALEDLQGKLGGVEVASCPHLCGDSGAGSGVAPPEPKAAA